MNHVTKCAEALREKFILKKRENLRCRYVTDQDVEAVIAPFLNQFLLTLATEGGAIVSSDACTAAEIEQARGTGRLFILDDGLGFVRFSRRWLEIAKPAVDQITTANFIKSAMAEENFHIGPNQ